MKVGAELTIQYFDSLASRHRVAVAIFGHGFGKDVLCGVDRVQTPSVGQ